MNDILNWTIISGILLVAAVAAFLSGIAKKSLKAVLIAVTASLLFLGASAWTVSLFVTKSYRNIKTAFRLRTGDEIYVAMFGKTDNRCVKVLKYQDQIIPKIDYAIWLNFKTCPDELKRILKLHQFEAEIKSTKGMQTDAPLANDNWFKPELLGDSVLIFSYIDERSNGQTIYSSTDSTTVFCIDVLD